MAADSLVPIKLKLNDLFYSCAGILSWTLDNVCKIERAWALTG